MNYPIAVKNKLDEGLEFKISKFKEIIKKTKPHKHDGYFEFIYLFEGEGYHWIDNKKVFIKTPQVFVLQPNQLHCWQFTAIPRGYIFMVKESFFDKVTEPYLMNLFNWAKKELSLDITDIQILQFALQQLYEERGKDSLERKSIVNSWLRIIFENSFSIPDLKVGNLNPENSIYSKFSNLLNTDKNIYKKVADYAAILNVTPQNLNYHCVKQTGKSASSYITDRFILEAKRLLLHTDQNINEIAFSLGFDDSSNFTKFFKNNTGFTPVNFRKFVFNSTI